MVENKTRPTDASVADYIASRADAQQAADCTELMALLEKITQEPPRMWGPSIVGHGVYRYTYDSGRRGDAGRRLRHLAKPLYAAIGFDETGLRSDDEVVARLTLAPAEGAKKSPPVGSKAGDLVASRAARYAPDTMDLTTITRGRLRRRPVPCHGSGRTAE
ncbi:MAG: hypothetical protein H0U69_01370 [Trueperaceae bacterium]|nr:hypothetical protein [Trueperaceae bacterium]